MKYELMLGVLLPDIIRYSITVISAKSPVFCFLSFGKCKWIVLIIQSVPFPPFPAFVL